MKCLPSESHSRGGRIEFKIDSMSGFDSIGGSCPRCFPIMPLTFASSGWWAISIGVANWTRDSRFPGLGAQVDISFENEKNFVRNYSVVRIFEAKLQNCFFEIGGFGNGFWGSRGQVAWIAGNQFI